CQQGNSYPYTF
nr:immunoglobulin light chain junction region [Macaca mulatta]MOX47671.1 immunoglobulin light chain junction region [Macaca mulatta]MOX47744.1 immunoglobulin light chain junction region [Macaca mulatta]MOX47800.1 immunoglobulin light chain junction region [Macaca mulatta]MOX47803.1 immunoglobulin light chain junction region [Macaca mulatta]